MKLVMIDLETMAVVKNAAILSIGATTFSVEEGVTATFYRNIMLSSCYEVGLISDAGTVEWWAKPAQDEARKVLEPEQLHVKDALIDFRYWMLRDYDMENIEVWANGTSFDLAIMETAYRAVGIPHPWKHWNERCYRTMKSLYRDVPKPSFEGTKHSALSDARFQTEHLIQILKAKAPCR